MGQSFAWRWWLVGNKERQIQRKTGSIIFRGKKCQTHWAFLRISVPPLVKPQTHKKSHPRCFSENTVMTLWIKASLIMGLSILVAWQHVEIQGLWFSYYPLTAIFHKVNAYCCNFFKFYQTTCHVMSFKFSSTHTFLLFFFLIAMTASQLSLLLWTDTLLMYLCF